MPAHKSTAAHQGALRNCKVWVEPLYAEAKEWHGSRRFRLRRLWRVNSEALMTAAGQNLKRLLAKWGWGRRPLPSGAALALKSFDGAIVCFMSAIILVEGHHPSEGVAPDTRQSLIAA